MSFTSLVSRLNDLCNESNETVGSADKSGADIRKKQTWERNRHEIGNKTKMKDLSVLGMRQRNLVMSRLVFLSQEREDNEVVR